MNPATVHLRGEYTKTKTSRTILLTKELTEQLKAWLRYKYRTRSIGYYDKNTRTATNKIIHPVVNPQVFIFSSNLDKNPDLRYLYTGFLMAFEKTLDRLGGKYAEYEDDNGKRRKITLHSFRRFVKGTISDLGLADYSWSSIIDADMRLA